MVWATGEDVRTKPTREQRREGKSEVGMRGKERWWLKNCLLLKEWVASGERERKRERARDSAPPSSLAYNYLLQLPDLSLVSPS